jgi:hypothetical protein
MDISIATQERRLEIIMRSPDHKLILKTVETAPPRETPVQRNPPP